MVVPLHFKPYRNILFTGLLLVRLSHAQSPQTGPAGPAGQPASQPTQPARRPPFPLNPRRPAPPQGQPGTDQTQGDIIRQAQSCVMEVITISANCFQNAGYQLQLVDAVISNGTITPLPPNANIMDLRRAMCK